MPLFTVIIPTHSHVATLPWAIRSVLDQSIQDFELIVVGDGAPAATELIMAGWCARDQRIQFQPNVKGAGYGELYRHRALQQARGSLVAYLGDDDLWLPHHLETLSGLLRKHDMAHTPMTTVNPEGTLHASFGRLDTAYGRACLLQRGSHSCGPTSLGHTLAAYQKLPFGWRPKPDNMNSDTYMWQQWLSQPWLNVGYEFRISTLHLGSPKRLSMSDEQRGEESGKWYALSRQQDVGASLILETLPIWASRIPKRNLLGDLVDSLVSGSPITPESVALWAALACESAGDSTKFILRKALLAQKHAQWETARQLYALVDGYTTDTTHLPLLARYFLNAGEFLAADRVFSDARCHHPDIAEQIANLRKMSVRLQQAR
jgi:glycosyltransferase involved in cell wall biosynthesis